MRGRTRKWRKTKENRDNKSNSDITRKSAQISDEKCKKTVDICKILGYILSYKMKMAYCAVFTDFLKSIESEMPWVRSVGKGVYQWKIM